MAIQGYQQAFDRTIGVGTAGVAASRGVWTAKAPSDTLDYWLDFSAVVAVNPTAIDPIAAVVSVGLASNLTGAPMPSVVSSGTDGTTVMVLIAGGSDGDNVSVSVQLTFRSGRTQSFVGVLPIRLPEQVQPVAPQQGVVSLVDQVLQAIPGDTVLVAAVVAAISSNTGLFASLSSSFTTAILENLPPQSAGIPENGFWITSGGVPQRAPTADLTFQLDSSTALSAIFMLDYLDLFDIVAENETEFPTTDLGDPTNASIALTTVLALEAIY